MQAIDRLATVVSSTLPAHRRLIPDRSPLHALPMNHASTSALGIALLLQSCAIMPPCYPVARDISGRVLDARTGSPIPTAMVTVRETGDPFHSSADGTFSTGFLRRFWSPPPEAFVTLRASARHYQSAEQRLPLSSDQAENSTQTHRGIVFHLEPK